MRDGGCAEGARRLARLREATVGEPEASSRRREGLEDTLRRIDAIGAGTEDDLLYTIRSLDGETAEGLRKRLERLGELREDARGSVRRQLDEAEGRACRRRAPCPTWRAPCWS